MTSSPDDYLHVKNQRYQLIPSSDTTADQRMLQSDWTSGPSCHTQSKVVVSDSTFPL